MYRTLNERNNGVCLLTNLLNDQHSTLNEYLLITYCVSCAALGAKDTVNGKKSLSPHKTSNPVETSNIN